MENSKPLRCKASKAKISELKPPDKKESTALRCFPFWISLPVVAPPQGNLICSGEVDSPCTKVLLRKTLATAHPRRPAVRGPGSPGIHTDTP